MTRVLVTGGTGFIGSRLVDQLVKQGHEVTQLLHTRPKPSTARGAAVFADILTGNGVEAAVREAGAEICIHLAWYTRPADYLVSPLNRDWLSGSLELLAALDAAGCRRTVIAGTCLEYAAADGPISEAMPLAPTTEYAMAKHELQVRAAGFQAAAGRSFAWPRVFYLYGPGERPERLVPTVVNRLLAGQPCALTTGTQVRDYLHVDDVAGALVAVALGDLEGPVNIGSGAGVTVADVARTIGALVGAPNLLRFGQIVQGADDPQSVVADSALLARVTGWRPAVNLRPGLAETVDWWRAVNQNRHAGIS